MDNSIVKITDLNGNLVYQTKSLGGQAIWNCRNTKGVRVASGVYLVLSATEDSKESVVTKIAVIKIHCGICLIHSGSFYLVSSI